MHACHRIAILCTASLLASALAHAQAETPRLEEVVVTGSRIGRSTFTTPNPVSVLNGEEMARLGLANVGDAVAQLPQNSAFVTAANVGFGNFNIGAQLANLRGLNPFFGTRTLTLVDGRRFVPSTNGGAVDLNLIPSNMVERIETVTGGASAIYGTDAVAGVVNVILDTKLEGFKGQVDPSATLHGDGKGWHAAAAYGTGLAGDRMHLIVGAEFQRDDGIGDCSSERSWCAGGSALYTNLVPGLNGVPNFVIGPNARVGNETPAGVFPFVQPFAPGLANTQFNAAGTGVTAFNPGNFVTSPLNFSFFGPVQGGDSPLSPYEVVTIRPPVKHYEGMAHLNFDLSETVQPFIEVSYGKREASNRQFSLGPTLATISSDNAYLPASVAAQINAIVPGIVPGFAFFNSDLTSYLRQINHTNNETWRGVIGVNGEVSRRWHWDAYYQYGENQQSQRLENLAVNGTSGVYNFLGWALDAVRDPSSGNIVCRATMPGPAFNPLATGCVPLNLFGTAHADPRALAYAYRTLPEDFLYQQQVAAATIRGNLFDGLSAGPVGVAVGAEYRRDSGNVTHQLATTPWYNDFGLTYGLDFKGRVKVFEAFGEMNVPLLKDRTFARLLELDGAVRRTKNTSSDDLTGASKDTNITTWKLSTVYDPLDWLRVRATRSKDIRAAGFRELFLKSPPFVGGPFGSVINPWHNNVSEPTTIQLGGSFDLAPEDATTTTAGLVFRFHGAAEGLQLSADWYEVEITEAITSPNANQLAQNCHDSGLFCSRINNGVDPDTIGGAITSVDATALNLSRFLTRGVDFEAVHSVALGRVGGSLSARLVASWLYDFMVGDVNWAGQTGPTAAFGDFNTSPRWQGSLTTSYVRGPFTGTVQLRQIGSGKYNVTYTGPDSSSYDPSLPNSISDNTVASATYVNVAGSYRLHGGADGSLVEVFGAVNNLFDRDPPVAPGGNGYPTNPVYFDTYGASWKAGIRIQF